MAFPQLENITAEIFFWKLHAENETGRLVPDHFLFFRKVETF